LSSSSSGQKQAAFQKSINKSDLPNAFVPPACRKALHDQKNVTEHSFLLARPAQSAKITSAFQGTRL
jgi:hypothetical protein